MDHERKRALNIFWTSADDYSVSAPFLVYDDEGKADLYWNCVVGSCVRLFDWEMLEKYYRTFEGTKERGCRENIFWIVVENAVSRLETGKRPVFSFLRIKYAKEKIKTMESEAERPGFEYDMSFKLMLGHLHRVLGDGMQPFGRDEKRLLDRIEAIKAESSEDILTFLKELFEDEELSDKEKKEETAKKPGLREMAALLFGRKGQAEEGFKPVRRMAFGRGEHLFEYLSATGSEGLNIGFSRKEGQTEEGLAAYISNYFGSSIYGFEEIKKLERECCTESHTGCHLYFTRGDYPKHMAEDGMVGIHRRQAEHSEKENLADYGKHEELYEASIRDLTGRIRNAMLVYLESSVIRSDKGLLKGGRVWRGLYLDDEKIFERELCRDPGDISVDILLDASVSQKDRQKVIAAEAFVIARSIAGCNIPVRVLSFCSMSGYTIMTVLRDYGEKEADERIFRYFTAGCNRDGLGIKMAVKMMEDNDREHRLLIVLSDCHPNDVIKIRSDSGEYHDYAQEEGVADTAREVRRARLAGISVMCVFTGDESDLPAAASIYDKSFIRISDLSLFAPGVAGLLQEQIRSFE